MIRNFLLKRFCLYAACLGLLVHLLAAPAPMQAAPITFTNTVQQSIPDPGMINSTLNVPVSGAIAKATLTVNITHSWLSDLEIKLSSPSVGATLILPGVHGGGRGVPGASGCVDETLNYTFDDAGAIFAPWSAINGFPDTTRPHDGTYKTPVNPGAQLSGFIGTPALGTWTLNVADIDISCTGKLNSWSLTLDGMFAVTPTITTITGHTPSPSVAGEAVTVQYSVTADSGTPTGNVTVSDGTTSCTAPVAAGQCSLILASAGAKILTATYGGDSTFIGSTSQGVSHTVSRASTTTQVSTAANPAVVGQLVAFTANVSATAPGGGIPTGSVTFKSGSTTLGTATLSGGSATFSTAALALGAHNIKAEYAGDSNFTASTSAVLTQDVNQANTITSVSSSSNPAVVATPIIFIANVVAAAPGAGTPTGSVTFYDGSTVLGSSPLVGGNATFTSPGLAFGTYTIRAVYMGNSNFVVSASAPLTQIVNDGAAISITAHTPNPSVVGQAVAVTYSVTSGAGTPTGSVTVSDGTTQCTATVAVGQCSLTFTSPGGRTLTATYSGDGVFNSATASVVHTVNQAATSTSIGARTPNPSAGQLVTIHFTVVAIAPGAGTPTGSVTVSDGTTQCTATVAVGECSMVFASAGDKTVTASYAGDSNFSSSLSPAVVQQVHERRLYIALVRRT